MYTWKCTICFSQVLSEGVCCYGRHLTIAHALYTNMTLSLVSLVINQVIFASIMLVLVHIDTKYVFFSVFLFVFVLFCFSCTLVEQTKSFLLLWQNGKKNQKKQKQKQKKGLFNAEIQRVNKHSKNDPWSTKQFFFANKIVKKIG